MKHLVVCREYPPAPSGGIGTYVVNMTRLLAEQGETVHVIGQMWDGAEHAVEHRHDGRLIIHRVPHEDWRALLRRKVSNNGSSKETAALFQSDFAPQAFSWRASLLAERLIEREGIDVIEAQEYEAPLYYLQLRRALGMGPQHRPPIIVHLHSPTEYIVKHNSWDLGHPYFLTAKRLEDYTILAADKVISPSRYLADQVENHLEMPPGTVSVIPYPLGDGSIIERSRDIWTTGTICYVGRLEPRKGIVEWIEAAVDVARDDPTAQFEFIGTNVIDTSWLAAGEALERQIPSSLRERFHFLGQQKRSSLPAHLARARIAVVPSRWDNLPHTCLEAMASGLPVLATRQGGMVEMIEHNVTGWLTETADPEDLRHGLRGALATSPDKLADMGRRSSDAVREKCNNATVLQRQLDLRDAVHRAGLVKSSRLPRTGTPPSVFAYPQGDNSGFGLVVGCGNGVAADNCLQSIKRQTCPPDAVVIVCRDDSQIRELPSDRDWQVISVEGSGPADARNAGLQHLLTQEELLLGLAFVDGDDQLAPDFVARCSDVLKRCPEVGIVSFWTEQWGATKGMAVEACPAFPYQWMRNDAATASALRIEALAAVGGCRSMESPEYEHWDLINAVMAAGWHAITVPAALNRRHVRTVPTYTNTRMLTQIYERFPELLARDALDIHDGRCARCVKE
jgi:glycosyltransferase involved in cell wall biosynthesis